jgi:hypothetical protein
MPVKFPADDTQTDRGNERRSTKWSVTTFDRRPSQFARDASKIFRLLRMASGLPTGERALDLSGQDSIGCSPPPAAMTASGFLQTSRSMSGNNQETIFDRKLVCAGRKSA